MFEKGRVKVKFGAKKKIYSFRDQDINDFLKRG